MLQHYQLYYLNVFMVKHAMYYNTIKIYKRAIKQLPGQQTKKKNLSDIFFFKFAHLSFFSSLNMMMNSQALSVGSFFKACFVFFSAVISILANFKSQYRSIS